MPRKNPHIFYLEEGLSLFFGEIMKRKVKFIVGQKSTLAQISAFQFG